MTTSGSRTGVDRSTADVMHDLVDALLAEGLLHTAGTAGGGSDAGAGTPPCGTSGAGERWARVALAQGGELAFRVRPAFFPHPWRLSRPPVLLVEGPSGPQGRRPPSPFPSGDGPPGRPVGPGELVRLLAEGTAGATGVTEAAGSAGGVGAAGAAGAGAGDRRAEDGSAGPPGDGPRWGAVCLVAADLDEAPAAVALARRAAGGLRVTVGRHRVSLPLGERLAALQDRPFHPLGRYKRGWSHTDARRWGPHAGRPFGLEWWAVPRSWLATGDARDGACTPGEDGLGPVVAELAAAGVLRDDDRRRLAAAARRAGTRPGAHVALPVHPWQARHLARLLDRPGGPVRLAHDLGSFRATASLRTLIPTGRPEAHLKLPLAVTALGADRGLPLRYLRNGDRGQHLLAAALAHPSLAGRVQVCDESSWWVTAPAAGPPDGQDGGDTPGSRGAAGTAAGAGGEPPDGQHDGGGSTGAQRRGWRAGEGELGCQVRRLPGVVGPDPGATLVPLAALGVTVAGAAPAVEALSAEATGTGTDQGSGGREGIGLLAALTTEMVRLATVCLARGVMPEAHGQNVLVAVRRGGVAGLVLRDHDTVRIHRPWLLAAGLDDPGYVVDSRTPNTLAPETPEGLWAWFQMLGINVGLYPVALALGAAGLSEPVAWRIMADAAERCLDGLEAWADLRPAVAVARHRLLESADWPFKLVLGPLLDRGATCGTSMPSAVAAVPNPLRRAR